MLTRVFFANSSSQALAESAHKWVEISLWLAFTRRESGPEAPPAQSDWGQLPRRYQTLQDRGAYLLARQHHKSYLGSCCWSSGPDGCTRSCCYHTKKIRHFHYHHWRCVLSFVLVEAFQYFNGLRCKSREESHSCSVNLSYIHQICSSLVPRLLFIEQEIRLIPYTVLVTVSQKNCEFKEKSLETANSITAYSCFFWMIAIEQLNLHKGARILFSMPVCVTCRSLAQYTVWNLIQWCQR